MLQSSRTTKHALNIIDRPLARSKLDIPTVSLSAYAYLFSELIGYAVERSGSITELEDRCVRRRGKGHHTITHLAMPTKATAAAATLAVSCTACCAPVPTHFVFN